MKRTIITGILIISFLISSNKATAWGHQGHALVAEVAFSYMNEATKKNVLKYLDGMSIEDAANWMDAIKSDSKNDYMKPYHYIDLEKGAKVMPAGDNIVSVLAKTLKELDHKGDLSDAEIKTRILFLFHLIGDLHQPLHVGYPGDKGGNDVKVLFFGRDSNLHSVWDTGIIENKNFRVEDILKANTYTPEVLATVKRINIAEWAKESRSYLKDAYKIRDGRLSEFYTDDNAKIIRVQLLNAGIRLAAVLEHYFDDEVGRS